MKRQQLGELNGKWSILFKLNQVMWAILLPVLLAVILGWVPWVTKQTILNEQHRNSLLDQKEAIKSEMREWHRLDIEQTMSGLRQEQKKILDEITQLKYRLPNNGR